MASTQPIQVVVERADIHKSCRALEVIVNLLDDYSEAARAIVTLHKKLAKALRDAATVKPMGEIPGNAFTSSAGVFEVLSDVDSKFSKFVDKECDIINGEVKKWFKKLAKEEKAHDERIASANAKIKQAGQVYEKKAKRGAIDVNEEHNRYINLLNTLGPEISQTKYNHALFVSQRNNAVTFQVAATLSRVSEAEWLRTVEGIRRFSPLIGQLVEWKAFCEGEWAGSVPGDLPDVAQMTTPPQAAQEATHDVVPNLGELGFSSPVPRPSPDRSSLRATFLKPPPAVYDDGSVRSVASLGAFPEPPNHFPIPPLSVDPSNLENNNFSNAQRCSLTPQGDGLMQPRTSLDKPGSSPGPPVVLSRLTESPLEERPALINGLLSSELSQDQLGIPTMNKTSAAMVPNSPVASVSQPQLLPVSGTLPGQQLDPAPSATSRSSSSTGLSSTFKRGDYLDNREFGVDSSAKAAQLKAKTLDSTRGDVERSDTSKSNGGLVAAIRDKYTRATGPASPPPRDIPRLPLSVATIATKYQSESGNEPAWQQTRSPTNELSQTSRDPGQSSPHPQQKLPSIASGRIESSTDELARRRQRIEELEELERREHALEVRAREREFEVRQRGIETLRSRTLDGYESDTPRSNRVVPPYGTHSQSSVEKQLHGATLTSGYSYSTTSLLPPGASAPANPVVQRAIQHAHLPDCQCPACTIARYAEQPLTTRSRPQEREKSKGGWMRRLSMPVGNAFSSEAKKLGLMGGKGVNAAALSSLREANRSAVSLGSPKR